MILKIIIDSHKVIDKVRQNLMCLDAVKTYGNKPMKLLVKIIINNLNKIIILE